jgi:hypothetical protein
MNPNMTLDVENLASQGIVHVVRISNFFLCLILTNLCIRYFP